MTLSSPVNNIDPPSSDGVAPMERFSIAISFSSVLYKSNRTPLTTSDAVYVQNSFYLQGQSGTVVIPDTATASSTDARKWTVSIKQYYFRIFWPKQLSFAPLIAAGQTFTLGIQQNQLFTSSGDAVNNLPAVYKYTTVDCGPNSIGYDSKSGICVCQVGYP